MQIHAHRFLPGQDLYEELKALVPSHSLRAGAILTCVGSLTTACLRMAGQSATRTLQGPFEIVSLVGTLCPDGIHVHVALSGAGGHCTGGHLLPGCEIYTTAEVVVAELAGVAFTRGYDPKTKYKELEVSRS